MSAGAAYEDAASELLGRAGLKVLQRNFRCKMGEIDIVCEDGSQLVFVEVRARNNRRYGSAAASVTRAKQRKLIRAAQFFLLRHKGLGTRPCRFDVVAFGPQTQERQNGQANTHQNEVQWVKNAFSI